MNRCGGGIEWSKSHNSRFEPTKLALLHFSRGRAAPRPSLTLAHLNVTVKPEKCVKYLGILIDQELRWSEQAANAKAKATAWVSQFRRLSRPSTGMPAKILRRMYIAVAIP
ncbi:hypothetical protein OF83DRAFT_1062845, partial [Amylostereum chailletii]